MTFTLDSIVANTWANAVIKGEMQLEEVPDLSNLRVVVSEIIKGVEENV